MSAGSVRLADEVKASREDIKAMYDKLCASYLAIDTFRGTLLGLLPLASAGGVFLLYSKDQAQQGLLQNLWLPIGMFGFAVTFGLYLFEIYAIEKCDALIAGGKALERQLHVSGQFTHRPRAVGGVINEPFASAVIYSTVLAVWVFLALSHAGVQPVVQQPASTTPTTPAAAWLAAAAVFVVAFGLSLHNNRRLDGLGNKADLLRLSREMLEAEESGDYHSLGEYLREDFRFEDGTGQTLRRDDYLKRIPVRANRGRKADGVDVSLRGWPFFTTATYTCRLRMHANGGRELVGQNALAKLLRVLMLADGERETTLCFDDTRHFVKQGDNWLCTAWQVIEIPRQAEDGYR